MWRIFAIIIIFVYLLYINLYIITNIYFVIIIIITIIMGFMIFGAKHCNGFHHRLQRIFIGCFWLWTTRTAQHIPRSVC